MINFEKIKWKKILIFLSEAIFFIAVFYFIYYIWKSYPTWLDEQVKDTTKTASDLAAIRGQFGDKFGAINALFAGLAFAGIIITLLLQRRDLIESKKLTGQERFDSTFFKLLDLHIDIRSKLSTRGGSGHDALVAFSEHLIQSDRDFVVFSGLQKLPRESIRGLIDQSKREANTDIFTELGHPTLDKAEVENLNNSIKSGTASFELYFDTDIEMHKKKYIDAYSKSALIHIDHFSHYFRNLYHILKFIDESESIDSNQKYRYSCILRSQLSDIELVCLFYNSLAEIKLPGRENLELGHPKMHRLLREYDILQNMNPRSIIHATHMTIFNNGRVERAK